MQLDYELPRLLQCLPGGHKGAASKAEEEMSRDPQAAVGQKEEQGGSHQQQYETAHYSGVPAA